MYNYSVMFYDWNELDKTGNGGGVSRLCVLILQHFSVILIIKFTYKPDFIARKHKPQKKILYSLCVFPSIQSFNLIVDSIKNHILKGSVASMLFKIHCLPCSRFSVNVNVCHR